MAIGNYDTRTLLGIMRQMEPASNYWLGLGFNSEMAFDTEYVDFEKLTDRRKIAPLVAPFAAGKPVFSEATTLYRMKPAYIKPKDVVHPERMMRRRPGELLAAEASMSPEARRAAIIADIMQTHRQAIERRWEWLAAQAIIYGKVTLSSDDYPTRLVDFQRDAGHTVTLGSGARWGDSGVSIYDGLQGYMDTMYAAKFGGAPNRLTIGRNVWKVMRTDPEIKEQMNKNYRGNNTDLPSGLIGTGDIVYLGRLDNNLEVYLYNDYYEDETGNLIPFMSPNDIVLTGSNIQGVRAFGAVMDQRAGMRPLPIFPKTWLNEDPSVEYCMSQSAPLMVPVNPNNTFRATVVAGS